MTLVWLLISMAVAARAVAPTAEVSQYPAVAGAPGTAWNTELPAGGVVPHCHPGRRPTPLEEAQPRIVGIATGVYRVDETFCTTLAAVRAGGAAMFRADLDWSGVETSPGVYDWRRYDAIVETTARFGLTFLPIIDRTPAWTGLPRSALPENLRDYASFVAAVVARYAPGGTFWRAHRSLEPWAPTYFELWNEPYFGPFANLHPDPGQYARMVRVAVQAGRDANPNARYLAEAELAFYDTEAKAGVNWVRAMYRAVPHLTRFIDGIAVHPYSYAGLGPGVRTDKYPLLGQTRRVAAIQREFAHHGAGNVPMWITEIGWPSCTEGLACVDEATQARNIRRLGLVARHRWPYVRALFVYNLRDYNSSATDGHFGLERIDASKKPAWGAFRQLTRQFSGSSPSRSSPADDERERP
jgi:hypothetical protein